MKHFPEEKICQNPDIQEKEAIRDGNPYKILCA